MVASRQRERRERSKLSQKEVGLGSWKLSEVQRESRGIPSGGGVFSMAVDERYCTVCGAGLIKNSNRT
jgi:hypothetical protein